jgi:hypothetical protein
VGDWTEQSRYLFKTQDEAQELYNAITDPVNGVAAYWLPRSDSGRWSLYVASDKIDESNRIAARHEISRIEDEMNDPYFDRSPVRLVDVNDPLVKAVVAFNRQYPGHGPFRVDDDMFRGISVEGLYIYPESMAAYLAKQASDPSHSAGVSA